MTITYLLGLLVTGAAAALAAQHLLRAHKRAAAARRRSAQLPVALERMAAALRTGSSLPQALAEAGYDVEAPLGPELAGLARMVDTGSGMVDALDRWIAQHDDSGTRLAATALVLSAGVGAAPARALDGVATTLRDRISLAGERRAQGAQARCSAAVLSAAPVAFTGLLVAGNRAAGRFLLGTPLGWTCLLAGLGLDLTGALWMARLIRTAPGTGSGR